MPLSSEITKPDNAQNSDNPAGKGPADDILLERFRGGDVRAFNEIVNRYRERVYWVARRMTGSHADADDIVQDVFLRAHEHLPAFRGQSSLYTWLYRITVNVTLTALGKKKVREFLSLDTILDTFEPGQGRADDPVLQQEYETLLEQAVASLPDKQRLAFVMKYYDEIPFDEMAAMLNRSAGGLKANYFHAVQKIQKFMRNAYS